MYQRGFPVIDPIATGENIVRLRKERGLSVRDLQTYFGFEEPQAIYKWQWGKSLPSVDNLYALGALLDVPMEEILVATKPKLKLITTELGAGASGSSHFLGGNHPLSEIRQKSKVVLTIFRPTMKTPRPWAA